MKEGEGGLGERFVVLVGEKCDVLCDVKWELDGISIFRGIKYGYTEALNRFL